MTESNINKHDIIVIGAGLSGLTAAAYATIEGKSVLLLEKNNTPGGFSTSFKRGRFEFDVSLKTLCGLSNNTCKSDLTRILTELKIIDKINYCEIPQAYRVITKTPTGTDIDITLPFGIDNYIDKISEIVPESKSALITLFNLGQEVEDAVGFLETIKGQPSSKDIRTLKKEYGNFIRTAPYSVNDVLISLDVPKKARDILTAMWVDFGVDCDKLNFTHFMLTLFTYIKYGSKIPKERSSALTFALMNVIKANGGEIRFNSPVTRILFDNGKASGVILKNGERIYSNHIICTTSPTIAYSKMMKEKDVPISAIKRTNARTFGGRGACIYLGLNRSAEELGIKDYITYISDINDSGKQFELMKSINTNNAFTAVCLNIANPEASPKGTCILTFSTIYTDNCWANVPPEQYYDEKDMLAARFIANYEERTGIKIHNSIEELEVATPITFARYTNSPQGVIYGYYPDDWDGIIPRIMTEKTDNDTVNLRFCGGWSTQLSGVHSAIATGRNTLYATLDDIEKEGGNSNE